MKHTYTLSIKGFASFSIEPNLLPAALRSIFRYENGSIATVGHDLTPAKSTFDDLVFYFDKDERIVTFGSEGGEA